MPSFIEANIGTDPRDSDLGLAWPLNFSRFDVKVIGENMEILDFGELGKLK